MRFLAVAFLVFIAGALMIPLFGSGPTLYYVDPPFTGGGNNGSAANPWRALTDGCATINSTLAAGNDVTVYFSATQSQSTQINLNCRTDTGTHLLQLNGTEQVNVNDGVNNNVTAWTAGAQLAPCTGFQCAKNGSWIGHQYTVTSSGAAITSNNAVNACQGFIDIRGFKFVATGQLAVLTYVHDLTYEYNDSSDQAGSIGPGVYIGPGQHGPCNASSSNAGGPDNVTYQYNWTYNTFGECLYVGATTSDPPGGPGNAEYITNGMTCTTACNTGAHYRIVGNTHQSCAVWGGQGDGTDIKDGHQDLWFIGNTLQPSFPPTCVPTCSQPAGNDGQGVVMESGAIVAGNYIEAPGHEGVAIFDSWNNATGRNDGLLTYNNIVVNIKSGIGHNNGMEAQPQQSGANQQWNSWGAYNNTIFSTNDPCFTVSSAVASAGLSAENNICHSAGGTITGSPLGTHDYNLFFSAGTCPVTGEGHDVCADPQFVSTATPYNAVNFKLQAASPAKGAGVTLSSLLTTDYGGSVRLVPWNMGAWQPSSAVAPCPVCNAEVRREGGTDAAY